MQVGAGGAMFKCTTLVGFIGKALETIVATDFFYKTSKWTIGTIFHNLQRIY